MFPSANGPQGRPGLPRDPIAGTSPRAALPPISSHRSRRPRGGRDADPVERAVGRRTAPIRRERAEPPTLVASGIDVSFGSVRALDDVSLRLFPGEIHSILGENGAGKSTLVGVLAGVVRPQRGDIMIDGRSARLSHPSGSIAHDIATVFQDQQLCPILTVGENVMLGNEVRGWWGINWRATHTRAQVALAALGIGDLDPRTRLDLLSSATRQLVAIARATVTRPRVLILDEPTSSLEPAEVEMLFAVIRRLKDAGVAIVFISHFLEQVLRISDRMTILRDGRRVGEFAAGELSRAQVISKMLGKDLDALRNIRSHRLQHRREPDGDPVYAASNVGRQSVFAPTDLELHRGEVVGLAGLRGSGRTEFARMLGGIDRRDSGLVLVGGKPLPSGNDSATLAHGIAIVTEDRRGEGIIADLTARQNMLLGMQAVRGWRRRISASEGQRVVSSMAAALRISPDDLDRPVRDLSGGVQQKVVLARNLATNPIVLILDEPTRGLDIETTLELHFLVASMAASGTGVVFISSELEEVVRLSDRIVILKDRQTIGELSNGPGLTVDSIVEIIASDY